MLTDNFAELSTSFKKSNLGKLATGNEFQPLKEELQKRELATFLHMRPWFGFDWEQMSGFTGPGAVVIFPYANNQFGVACLLDATASSEARAECLAIGEKYFLAKKYRKVLAKSSGHELIIYEPPGAKSGQGARVHFTSGNMFGAANSRAAAEALLATKDAASLAKQATFQQLTARESTDPTKGAAQMFVRPVELWSLSRNDGAKAKPSPRDPIVMARREGIENLQAAGGVVQFSPDKTRDVEFSLRTKVKSPLKRAMGLLDFKAGAGRALPEWCASDSSCVLTWQWDFSAAMKAFGNLFDELNEPGPDGEGLFDDLLSGLRDDPEGPRVDLRKDLFSRLGPQVVSISDNHGTPSAQNPTGRRSLNIAACREVPLVATFLKRLYAEEKNVAYEKLGEIHVWTAKTGDSLFVEGEEDSLIKIRGVALTPSELMYSSDIAFLRTALAAKVPAEPLSKNNDWRALQDWLKKSENERTALRAFVRLDQFLEPGYINLRSGKPQERETADVSLLRLLLFGTFEKKPAPPYGALPDFKILRNRLRPLGFRLSLTDDGWQVRGGSLGSD